MAHATTVAAVGPSAKKAEKANISNEERIAFERLQLESKLAHGELNDVRTRVAFILNQYPVCRNSDAELWIKYWRVFFPDDVGTSSISFEALRTVTAATSITRARATIQNTYGLFRPDEAIAALRDERQGEHRTQHCGLRQSGTPLVHVYSDESGKTARHYIVGSLWVNDFEEQTYKLMKRLWEWRKSIERDREFHFTDMSASEADVYVEFVQQALQSSDFAGFKAIVLPREDVKRRPPDDVVFTLYYRLVVSGIQHEVTSRRFTLPRSIIIHKDEDEGADKLHLLELRDKLQVQCPMQFDYQINIPTVQPLKSSTNILMQLADVFTGVVNRLVNREANAPRNHKDQVAETIWRKLGGDPDRKIDRVDGDFLKVFLL